ncbi:LysE family translocator [Rhizobacter sp. OV335]|uniref:LysE family translocator n=1 Tax=Rhizobacter sp. OV335 TaxID=1500264 RepID=UPI000919C597|nr:LysE family translocator [Rhizobacter sp. OV335]SHN40469.1 Threonine/homoserine/homoserine lactone efflux protein [Rhizobacter sp. OV335]
MALSDWLAFLFVSLFVTFTPGPAVLLAVSNSLSVGPARAMISSLGNAVGLLLVSTAATAGLGVVLQTSATAFLVLKLLGAGYLVYLGIRQWRSGGAMFAEASGAQARASTPAWRLFGNGLTVALTNPKAILFFTALFPQFMHAGAGAAQQFVMLTVTFAGCAVFAHAVYVLLARSVKGRLAEPRRSRLLNRVFGGSFVVLGVSLLGLRSKAA